MIRSNDIKCSKIKLKYSNRDRLFSIPISDMKQKEIIWVKMY